MPRAAAKPPTLKAKSGRKDKTMAYMSYCRHEGTLAELRGCIEDANDHINEEARYEVSDKEIYCFKKMVEEFYEFLCEQELIDQFGELDSEELDKICESMRKGYGEDNE